MGNSGPFILRRSERISQTGRRLSQRVAGRPGSISFWFGAGPVYRQATGIEPLGTAAVFAYSAGALRIGGLLASGRCVSTNSPLTGDGAFLSLSGLYGDPVSMGYR